MTRFFGGLVLAGCLAATQVQAQGIRDSYGPLIQWKQASGWEVTPIHVGLMPNGQLMLVNEYNYMEHPDLDLSKPPFPLEFPFLMQVTPLDAPMPATVAVQPMTLPSPFGAVVDPAGKMLVFKGLVCSGHTLMSDGNMFFASGSEADIDLGLYAFGFLDAAIAVNGIAESVTYNPATQQWKSNPDMVVPGPQTGRPLRWYGTVTRLADSRMLVTGGYEKATPTLSHNTSVEVYDPATNAWTPVSDQSITPPGIQNPDYTHVFQYPEASGNENVVEVVGGSGEALFLHMGPQGNHWVQTGKYRPGAKEQIDLFAPMLAVPNFGSSSAMLPLRLPESSWGYTNGSILYAWTSTTRASTHGACRRSRCMATATTRPRSSFPTGESSSCRATTTRASSSRWATRNTWTRRTTSPSRRARRTCPRRAATTRSQCCCPTGASWWAAATWMATTASSGRTSATTTPTTCSRTARA
jgi:hypothetical protein